MRTSHRRLRAAVAGTLLGLAFVVSPAAPAGAAEEPMIGSTFGSMALPVGLGPESPGKTKALELSVYGSVAAQDLRVRFDSAQVDKVLVTPPGSEHGCTTSGTQTICTRALVESGQEWNLPFTFRVAPGTQVGDYDFFEFMISAANKATEAGQSAVVDIVASGPDLTVDGVTVADVPPGATIDFVPAVYNAGDRAANGLVLRFTSLDEPEYLSYMDEHADCVVEDGLPVCVFDDVVLEPGQFYRIASPLRFRSSEATPWPMGVEAYYSVWPMNNGADTDDNGGRLWVQTTRNPADLTVSGVKLFGSVGDTMPVTATVTNRGPADTDSRATGSPGALSITAPTGTVFASVGSRECAPYIDGAPDWARRGQPGYQSYFCMFDVGRVRVGESTSFAFTLTITGTTVADDGILVVHPGGVPDDNPRNNTAPLEVKLKPAA